MPSDKRARQRAQRDAKRAAAQKAAQRQKVIRRVATIAVVAVVLIGSGFLLFGRSSSPAPTTTTTTTTTAPLPSTTTTTLSPTYATAQTAANAKAVAGGCPASPTARANNLSWTTEPPITIDTAKTYYATVKTTVGSFTIALDPKQAPHNVNNFIFLAHHGFYNCVTFHRVIPNFVIQGGDPTGTGTGGPGYQVTENEYPAKAANAALQYPVGSVAMANSGSGTNGSQFFVVTGVNGEGLPNQYTLLGKVVSGIDVVQTISNYGTPAGVPPNVIERMLSVTVTP